MLVLTADKGYLSPETFDFGLDFNLVVDGSLATMVNFHAVSRFLQAHRSDTFYSKQHQPGIQLCPLLLNGKFVDFPDTTQAITHSFSQTTPSEMLENVKSLQHRSLDYLQLVDLITMTFHDPLVCSSLNPQFLSVIPSLGSHDKQHLSQQLKRVADKLYFMPNEGGDVVLLSQIFRCLNEPIIALFLIDNYIKIFGETFWLCFESALNHLTLNQIREAHTLFEKAHKKDPNHIVCKQYLDNCYI